MPGLPVPKPYFATLKISFISPFTEIIITNAILTTNFINFSWSYEFLYQLKLFSYGIGISSISSIYSSDMIINMKAIYTS